MPEQRTLYGLSDIKNICVPCSNCSEAIPFPNAHDFAPRIEQRCPSCDKHGFGDSFRAIARIKLLAEQYPVLRELKFELNGSQ